MALRLCKLVLLFACAPMSTVASPTAAASQSGKTVAISNSHPLIYYHGRWDDSPGTWWAGSGFKLNVANLKSLALNLGNHSTTPSLSVGVSVDYDPFFTVNISEGRNVIPLTRQKSFDLNSVVRINVEGWQNNRMNLESIEVNQDALLLPYVPSPLVFQFIGDSLSAGVGGDGQGQFLPMGVDQAWTFLIGEAFKAEHTVVAQPGATLTDMVSYGNAHGMSFQFFQTEDTGYYYTTDHNYTTPWNFKRDIPAATHVIIHLGANDSGQNVPAETFVQNYLDFLAHLRTIYVRQPFLIFTPWGWPQSDGTVSYYYDGRYQEIYDKRKSTGDHNIFLVNTTGWVTWDDVFHDNLHPTVEGHQKIAGLFTTWLTNFGVNTRKFWPTIDL